MQFIVGSWGESYEAIALYKSSDGFYFLYIDGIIVPNYGKES